MFGSPKRSAVISALIHCLGIVCILALASAKHSVLTDWMPVRETPVYLPVRVHAPGSAGGGGQHSPLPAGKGQPPKAAPRVFVPPMIRAQETHAQIEIAPALLSSAEMQMPALSLPIGILTGVNGPPSGGPGGPRGIGNGNGDQLGDGNSKGPGGDGDAPYGLRGKPVTQPVLLSRRDPEYSEEARKAKFQGVVELSIVVNAGGQVTDVHVIRGIGLGLDERAVEAVKQWKFRAGTVDGRPVSTRAVVEVNFRLL